MFCGEGDSTDAVIDINSTVFSEYAMKRSG